MSKLTKTEKEILLLINEGIPTISAIAHRRKVSKQAVHKIVKKLRSKGVIGRGLTRVDFSPSTRQPFEFRLNGWRARCNILEFSQLYWDSREKGNILHLNGCTVELRGNAILVHIRPVFAHDVWAGKAEVNDLLFKILNRLEARYKITLIKEGKNNIKIYEGEVAKVHDELAQMANGEGTKIVVPDPEDGKRAIITDLSKGMDELETVHPDRQMEHMADVIVPFYQDLLKNKPPVLSEQWLVLSETLQAIRAQSKLMEQFMKEYRGSR